MASTGLHTLPQQEIVSGRTAVGALTSKGRWSGYEFLKTCVLFPNGTGCNRIMVSVPKRLFKRAVKRNLLKRRLREAYRLQKERLCVKGVDILFVYASKEVLEFDEIFRQVGGILDSLSARLQESSASGKEAAGLADSGNACPTETANSAGVAERTTVRSNGDCGGEKADGSGATDSNNAAPAGGCCGASAAGVDGSCEGGNTVAGSSETAGATESN